MRYREVPPAPALAEHVQCYAEFVVEAVPASPYLHLVVPDGCAHLTYLCPSPRPGAGPVLTGPRMRSGEHEIRDRLLCWDVKLRPHGLGLLGVTADTWRDGAAPLGVVAGVVAGAVAGADGLAELGRRIETDLDGCATFEEARGRLDELLTTRLPESAPLDRVVAATVERIEAADGRLSLAELARPLAIGERQLQRRFRRAVGLTPKEFSRIRRFRACARNLIVERPESWGRIAVTNGYADQAHLGREFARLTGRSPTRLAEYVASIEHGDVNV